MPRDNGLPAIECLLITGTVGAGKSAVAREIGELMRLDAVGFAVIDLDAIARCTTDPPVPGRFEHALLVENLAAIWPNYRRFGVTQLVLARAVVTEQELDGLRRAVPGSRWTVCRLVAPEAVVAGRLESRETGIARDFLLSLACGLAEEMEANHIEDVLLDNGAGRGLTEVAREVLDHWRNRTADA